MIHFRISTFVVAFIFPLALFAGKPKGNTVITGVFTNASGKTVYFERFNAVNTTKMDSAVVNKKGKFIINAQVDSMDFFKISIDPKDFLVLILKPGERVELSGDDAKLNKTYRAKGSVESVKLNEFVILVNTYVDKRDSIQNKVKEYAGAGDKAKMNQANTDLQVAYNTFIADRNAYVAKYSDSPALLGVLSHINPKQDFEQLKKIESALLSSMPKSPYYYSVKSLRERTESEVAEEIRRKKEQEELANRLAPGKLAPEINMNDREGKPLPLSSLRGKVVLIDFWASWCGPCRKENPTVVAAYAKYKDKGFTVYSVSLDNSKPNWLAAIEKDQLTWPNHVSSLAGWGTEILREYGINAIPFTVLIDREGKIVQTNLRGQMLLNKLQEIFGF
jgi:thiol-disulfide isomerase/thioredoxin